MGEVSKEFSKLVKKFGSKILFIFFLLELLITSSIWITEKITFELGFGNIFLLNIYVLLLYIINLVAKWKEPNKHEYTIIIDFYLSVIFWGISRMMDFFEFNILLFNLVLGYLGVLMSIIYLLPNPKPKRESHSSLMRFALSIIMVLLSILIFILVLIIPPTLLPLIPAEMQLSLLIFYIVLFIALLILKFKPETKEESP